MTLEKHDEKILGVSFEGHDLTGATFEDCRFEKCDFKGADLTGAKISSCVFIACDLSNATLNGARIRETAFESCKLLGLQWFRAADLVNPSFKECNLSYASFAGLKLKKTGFAQSLLRDADLSQADLSECDLKGCDLANARFQSTNLMKADFRGALNYLVDPLSNKVRGARFTLPEAYGLLAGLGVVIE